MGGRVPLAAVLLQSVQPDCDAEMQPPSIQTNINGIELKVGAIYAQMLPPFD